MQSVFPITSMGTICFPSKLDLAQINSEYSSSGIEFYIGAARNYRGNAQYLHVTVSTISASPVPFILETSSGILHNGSITFSNPQTIAIPTDLMVLDSTYANRNKGIRIFSTSGFPISVILLNFQTNTVGEYLAFPCSQPSQPEYEYLAPSTGTLAGGDGSKSQVLLVGCEDNTNITVIATQPIEVPKEFSSSSSANIKIAAGMPYQITLHQMQTFLFGSLMDFSGTRIVSNKPLTVISGHECGNVPANVRACEHLTVQVPPTTTLGQTFFLVPFAGRTGGQYFKAIASQSDTTLYLEVCNSTDGSNATLFNVGDSFQFWTSSNTYCALVANKPILLSQLSPGVGIDGTGDPTICLVPAIEQFVNKLAFVSFPESFENQFVSISVQSQFFDPQNIFLDGSHLLNSTWNPIRGRGNAIIGYATRHQITGGSNTHTVYHEDTRAGLSVVVYGFSPSQSFTYNGGLQFTSTTEFAGKIENITVILEKMITYLHTWNMPWYTSESMHPYHPNYNIHSYSCKHACRQAKHISGPAFVVIRVLHYALDTFSKQIYSPYTAKLYLRIPMQFHCHIDQSRMISYSFSRLKAAICMQYV